jgi:hypothetical protein
VLCSQIKGAEDKQNIYFDSADQGETKEEMRWLDSAVIQPFFYQPVTEQNLSIIFDFGGTVLSVSEKYDGSDLFYFTFFAFS